VFGFNFLEIFGMLILGVILFGKDLPTVAKSLGKMLMDLRSGFRNLHEGIDRPAGNYGYSSAAPIEAVPRPARISPSVPKFTDDLLTASE
jgi:hypothetical protein